MELVSHTEGSCLSYPDVTPNAREWVWSDKKPKDAIVRVTAHGLRRLLRLAFQAQRIAGYLALKDMADIYAEDATPEKALALYRETSTIWCEANLVMSRLFVDPDGKVIAHADEEVDEASVFPWEREQVSP